MSSPNDRALGSRAAQGRSAPVEADVAVVGAGAAGLMAALWAARAAPHARVVLLEGARTLGAKILVSGGGRCNVTHERVEASDFHGSTRPAIAKILARFDVPQTIAFFAELGVQLKREDTGKLFPVSDRADTVLQALLAAVRAAGVVLEHPRRVETIERGISPGAGKPPAPGPFLLGGAWGSCTAGRVILATGGASLPKSGSDGHGYDMARALGHSVTPELLPALVPLTLPDGHFLRALSGLAAPAEITVHAATGRRIGVARGPVLCTHFGVSGPAVLDISRQWLSARRVDAAASLRVDWLPGTSADGLDGQLQRGEARTALAVLRNGLPERLARALCAAAGVDPVAPLARLPREPRRALVAVVKHLALPVSGDRGFAHAEVTAGGVPLAELRLQSLESRLCPGLHLCGEICDVDGRLGGFNFQWAWASGYVAGVAAGSAGAAAPLDA